MKGKIVFLAGGAAGYVLGTRDGRRRYDQMKGQAQALWQDPRVQEKVGEAKQQARAKADQVVRSDDPTTAAGR